MILWKNHFLFYIPKARVLVIFHNLYIFRKIQCQYVTKNREKFISPCKNVHVRALLWLLLKVMVIAATAVNACVSANIYVAALNHSKNQTKKNLATLTIV